MPVADEDMSAAMRTLAQLPGFAELPAVMPVSQIGRGGYLLRVSVLKAHGLVSYLAVFEDELADPPALV